MSTNFNQVSNGSPVTPSQWNDNWLAVALQNISQQGVGLISGGVLSDGGSLSLVCSASVVLGNECVSLGSFSGTVPANATRYVWLDWSVSYPSGVTTYTPNFILTTTPTNPGGTVIPLGMIVTGSSTITVYNTNRCELARWLTQFIYKIGQGRIVVDEGNGWVGINKTPAQPLDIHGNAYSDSAFLGASAPAKSHLRSGDAGYIPADYQQQLFGSFSVDSGATFTCSGTLRVTP